MDTVFSNYFTLLFKVDCQDHPLVHYKKPTVHQLFIPRAFTDSPTFRLSNLDHQDLQLVLLLLRKRSSLEVISSPKLDLDESLSSIC